MTKVLLFWSEIGAKEEAEKSQNKRWPPHHPKMARGWLKTFVIIGLHLSSRDSN